MNPRPPVPPFTEATARQKIQASAAQALVLGLIVHKVYRLLPKTDAPAA